MPKRDPLFDEVSAICLSLPDTKLTYPWGAPHFRVGEKIFSGYGESSISLKLEMDHADALVQGDPRFTRAAYVGHKGWVEMDVSGVKDWGEVRALIEESYRLIAAKRSLAKLDGGDAKAKPAKKRATSRAKKPAARRPARRVTS